MTAPISYPRLSARTRRFTLGEPHAFTASADGTRVLFLRSLAGDDARTALWLLDLPDGEERMVVDPSTWDSETLTAEERARRERVRETANGVVAYSADRDCRRAAFAASGVVHVVDLESGRALSVPPTEAAFDPRLDPTGQRLAYVRAGGLRCIELSSGRDTVLVEPDRPDVAWGVADFVAAEELDRARGYWWSPDGQSLLVARVDEAPVPAWWITDPANPAREPRRVRYPAAGADNAVVTLHHVTVQGEVSELRWDRDALPYLARVTWTADGPPLLQALSRDQRRLVTFAIDLGTHQTRPVHEERDDVWVEPFVGVPTWFGDRVVRIGTVDGRARLLIGDEAVTGLELQVRAVAGVTDEAVVFTASYDDPTQVQVVQWSGTGLQRLTDTPGVHSATVTAGATVIASASMTHHGLRHEIASPQERRRVASLAVTPPFEPTVAMQQVGSRKLRVGLLLPRHHDGSSPLPVLMDPYGGPHAQRVLQARRTWLEPQWFADQGFAVLVVDGRGTPGRDAAWEQAVHHDFTATLDDQVEALQDVAEANPVLDLSRVAIRGWSFGGYLAALAVLRRPDVFSAAVAGAPVTDWRLYDTCYTERYLGSPSTEPDVYRHNSLLDDAPSLSRPLLIIHGLADDNVVAAHTLQLSQRLTENGRLHSVLPLTGVTHMTPQEAVAENLMLLQVQFLRDALGVAD